MIDVLLYAYYREGRGKKVNLDEKDYPTIQEVIDHLSIEAEGIGIILLNGFHAKTEDKLQDGDTLALYPPVAGG